MSKSLPYAHTPGKRNRKQDKEEETRGSSSSHKLDPKVPIAYGAICGDCGSLGSYFSQRDATNAENLHQQRNHANSPHKKTTTADTQGRRNKHGGK